jgi:hypothetical protein
LDSGTISNDDKDWYLQEMAREKKKPDLTLRPCPYRKSNLIILMVESTENWACANAPNGLNGP